MTSIDAHSRFEATLLRPVTAGDKNLWAFVVLPRMASEKLPRRGRTSIDGQINGHAFQALLEPDGQLSHWLKIDQALMSAVRRRCGDR